MKKKLLFILCSLLIGTAYAQPNFTSSYHPSPGQTSYEQPIYISGLSLGATGAAKTWNYTTVTDSGGIYTQSYVSPSSTNWGSLFPSSNDATGSNSTGYVYAEYTSSVFEILGVVTPDDTLTYSKPEVAYEYPFTYQSTATGTFAATGNSYNDGFSEIDTRTGTDTVNADGYGILELPNGTFQNVLRVVIIENYEDAFTIDGYPFDTIYERTYTVDYLDPNILDEAILSISDISETTDGYTTSLSTAYIYPYGPTSVNVINSIIENLNLYPNPSSTQTTLSLNLQEASNINVYISNILGQKIKTINTAHVDVGQHNYTIETGDMAKGIYLVTVEVNGAIAGVRKLEIE